MAQGKAHLFLISPPHNPLRRAWVRGSFNNQSQQLSYVITSMVVLNSAVKGGET